MFAHELPIETAEAAIRFVRKMGAHRYIAGKLIVVHAFAAEHAQGALADWARRVIDSKVIDLASRDERLYARATEADLADILEAFWSTEAAHDRLRTQMDAADLPVPEGEPFDPDDEDETHPLLIDAGWELFPLTELDPEKHRGAILSFGESIHYESACFEEREAVPQTPPLQELSALGARELLFGAPTGLLTSPLVVWCEGNATYHDYILRGILRSAKIQIPNP